jgi:poly-gamma-glutamate synthesis protein (capsule biosynthesis protein)
MATGALLALISASAWPRPGEVTLVAVGDIMLARGVAEKAGAQGWDYPFAKTAQVIRGADIAVGNLECVLGQQGVAVPKRFSFSAPEDAASALQRAGFDLLSLANNHTSDRGRPGMDRTMELLRRHGIAYAGAGRSLTAAYRPTIVRKNGLKIAFLSYSDWTPEGYLTLPDRTSIALAEPEKIRASIGQAKRQADLVVVSFHWGVEHSPVSTVRQRKLAKVAVDAGADVVLGHHPHVRQPVAWRRSRPVFYSLGNFVFDQRSSDLSNGWLAVLHLSKGRVKVDRVAKVEIRSCQPQITWHNETDPKAGPRRGTASRGGSRARSATGFATSSRGLLDAPETAKTPDRFGIRLTGQYGGMLVSGRSLRLAARSLAHSTSMAGEWEDASLPTEPRRGGLHVLRLAPPSVPRSRTPAAVRVPPFHRPAGLCSFGLLM